MICPKCGKEIDNSSVICKFCGNNLMVNKSNLYKEESQPKEKKILGLVIISIVLLIIIVLAFVITYNRR